MDIVDILILIEGMNPCCPTGTSKGGRRNVLVLTENRHGVVPVIMPCTIGTSNISVRILFIIDAFRRRADYKDNSRGEA